MNREIETVVRVEYYKVTSKAGMTAKLIMVLNGKNAYGINNNKEWILKKGLYDYLFNNDDSLDRKIEYLDLQEAVKEAMERQIEIITGVEYYKVPSENGNFENFIMVLNNKYAYRLQENGKWIFKAGLYDYLFNSEDSLDRKIEILKLHDAIKEGAVREKKLGSKY